MAETLEDIRDTFALMDDWAERYRYVIELGRDLPDLPDTARTPANKVRGCASQVWLTADLDEAGRLRLAGDSDAHIVRGLIAILFAIFNGRTPGEAAALDPRPILDDLGLASHLSPTRANGLSSMVARINAIAEKLAVAGGTASA